MDKSKLYKGKDKQGKEINKFRDIEVFNICINKEYIDPDYSLIFQERSTISETGLIKLFLISSKNIRLPSFEGRWDERVEQVDIDINNVDDMIHYQFKNSKNGYLGHHSIRTIESPRTYIIEINIPEKSIFRGIMTFNIGKSHHPELFNF